MKKLIMAASICALSSLSFAPISTAQAADGISLRICEYISVNDKKRLRTYLKTKKLKIRNVFSDIKCNGQNILVFAASSNALDTGELIIGKVPSKVVAASLEEIRKHSAHLAAKAEKRING